MPEQISLPVLSLVLAQEFPTYRVYKSLVQAAGLTPAPERNGHPAEYYWSFSLLAAEKVDGALGALVAVLHAKRPELEPLRALIGSSEEEAAEEEEAPATEASSEGASEEAQAEDAAEEQEAPAAETGSEEAVASDDEPAPPADED